jgi:hypothetical protein
MVPADDFSEYLSNNRIFFVRHPYIVAVSAAELRDGHASFFHMQCILFRILLSTSDGMDGTLNCFGFFGALIVTQQNHKQNTKF